MKCFACTISHEHESCYSKHQLFFVLQIQAQQAILSEDELETHTIAAWKQEKYHLASVSDSTSPLYFVSEIEPILYLSK